jgi:hypothetical protein
MLNRLIIRHPVSLRKKTSFLNTPKKSISGYFFTRGSPTKDIVKGEKVLVYEGQEWQEMNKYLSESKYFDIVPKENDSVNKMYSIWQDCVMNTSFKAKYFGLLPFFYEDRRSSRAQKKFVLKMELYPEAKYLKFTYAMMSGVHEAYEPLVDVIPVTPGDYRIRHLVLRSRPPQFVDMDMVYGNRKIPEMYCFDKQGTWVQEVNQ